MAVNNCAGRGAAGRRGARRRGGEVIVSRGQLVEIGGGFRIPEVIAQAGARLVEVGTTNRTRLADYERASATGHRRDPARAPVELPPARLRRGGRDRGAVRLGVPVIDDVGSGVLADGSRCWPTSRRCAARCAAGAALVCFSGDKLLGGPQAGLLVGRAEAVAAAARAPARPRAAPGQALAGRAGGDAAALPRPRARAPRGAGAGDARRRRGRARARAQRLAAAIGGARGGRAAVAKVGGGALPLLELPGPVVALDGSDPGALAARAARAATRRSSGRIERRPAAARPAHAGRRGGSTRSPAPSRAARVRARRSTLGTAGHIDHGKTALVRALTGRRHRPAAGGAGARDLDRARLRAARAALGAAAVGRRRARARALRAHDGRRRDRDRPLPDGRRRRRRRDAADARARGRAARRSGSDAGVVAITKADVARSRPWRRARRAALLPAPRLVPVARAPARGSTRCAAALDGSPARLPGRDGGDGALRLHVDRAFTIRGAGTVVTGTLWSGTAARGDEVVILPARAPRPRARRRRSTTSPVERAAPASASRSTSPASARERGRAAATWSPAGAPLPAATYRVDVALEWAAGRAARRRRAASPSTTGRARRPARLAELGGRFCQLRLEEPLVAARGDRLVIRSLAPPDTLGGGVVLDPAPRAATALARPARRLARLERGGAAEPAPRAGRAAGRARRPPPLPPRRSRSRSACARAGHEPPRRRRARPAADARRAARPRPRRPPGPRHAHPPPTRWPTSRRRVDARDRARRARSRSPPCATSSDLAPLRPGAARGARRRARHAARRRRARAAPPQVGLAALSRPPR